MKSKHIIAAVLAVCLLSPSLARGADGENRMISGHSTVTGPTGLFTVPSAYILAPQHLSISAAWSQDRIGRFLSNNYAVSGAYGFSPRLEGGVFYTHRRNSTGGLDTGGGFFKYVLFPEGETEPGFAIGASAGGGDTSPINAYVVVSRNITGADSGTPVFGHLGLEYARNRNYPFSPAPSHSSIRPYVGFDLHISPRTALMGEVRLDHAFERKTLLGFGFTHSLPVSETGSLQGTLGMTNNAVSRGMRPHVQVGLSFPLSVR